MVARGTREFADDGDLGIVSDWQNGVIVLEEHHGFDGGLMCDFVVGFDVEAIVFDAHGRAGLVDQVDHALCHAVELCRLDAAVTCGVNDLVVGVAWRHFEVEARVEGGHAVVVGAPVAHDDALEAPFVAQHVGEQPVILGGMYAIDAVVCAHDGPRLGFLDDVFECREVDFAQRTLRDVGADAQTVGLLVVGGEMLERSAHALGLHACDNANGLMACQIRVFGPVFEAAAAKRVALDVHARTEDYGDLLLNALFGHGFADLVDEFRVPRAGQARGRREAGGWHAVVQVDLAGGGRVGLAQAVGAVGDHVAGNALGFNALQMPGVAAGSQGCFLFKCQVVDGRIDAFAHAFLFRIVFLSSYRLTGVWNLNPEIFTNRLVGTLSKPTSQHTNHL